MADGIGFVIRLLYARVCSNHTEGSKLNIMKHKKFKITIEDFLKANRKAAREEEIEKYGKPIIFKTKIHKSKKVYSRKNYRIDENI